MNSFETIQYDPGYSDGTGQKSWEFMWHVISDGMIVVASTSQAFAFSRAAEYSNAIVMEPENWTW